MPPRNIASTGTESKSCCGRVARSTVSECFDRGTRRSRREWLSISGVPCSDASGLRAQFSLEVADATISGANFKASSCVTLIAYCELLAATVTGQPLPDAIRLTPADLSEALPGVPLVKQDRAILAIRALQSAIAVATLESNDDRHRKRASQS